MTDMHREAFERWAKRQPQRYEMQRRPSDESTYESSMARWAWESWQVAIRHLTEQNEQRDSHE